MSFSSGAENIKKDILRISSTRCKDLFNKIVDDTPLDTGYASGNWQTSSSGSSSTVDRRGKDAAKSEIESVITDNYFLKNKAVYFFNNVDYAYGLEYGNPSYTSHAAPFSMQAPNGMVRVNIKNFTI